MYYIKKTLLVSLLTAATCVFYACSSDAPEVTSPKNPQEVEFATADVSRAVTTNINYIGSRFALFGDMKYSTGSPVEIFRNVEVKYNGDAWNYAGMQYWFPNHEHSFVAIYPAEVFKNDDGARYVNSRLSFSYTIPTTDGTILDKDGTLDLLVATHRRMYNAGGDNTIFLRFGHLMSLINFAPAFSDNLLSDDAYILLHRLELLEIATQARFDILPASRQSGNQTDDMEVDVATQETDNPAMTFTTPVKVKNHAESTNLFVLADALIMLPQSFSAESEAKIVFYYSINDETTMRQVELPLNNQRWELNNRYTYKFTIERSGLKLDQCEINPWTEIKGDHIVVD